MYTENIKNLLINSPNNSWRISDSFIHNGKLKDKDYIDLICLKCGSNGRHTLGNIKYNLFKNPDHCSCAHCKKKVKAIEKTKAFLIKAENTIKNAASLKWLLVLEKIKSDTHYNAKSKLPLRCKICGNFKEHSFSNILSEIYNSGHIQCQICKAMTLQNLKVEKWKKIINERFDGKFEIDSTKTEYGYRIIHKDCGNYINKKNPLSFCDGKCPYCHSNPGKKLRRLPTNQQLAKLILLESSGKLILIHFEGSKKIMYVKCGIHTDAGIYSLSWDSYMKSIREKGTLGCRFCQRESLRKLKVEEYNAKILTFGLKADCGNQLDKLDTKAKLLHICTNNNRHPKLLATPYEVISKNKRCPYCFENISFHKNYDFIKTYIEMDSDRFFSHSGRKFRLLSSRQDIEKQIRPFKNIGSVRLKMNELTCDIHNSYEVSWVDFRHRKIGCTCCSKERSVSYAHAYFQALLVYFEIDFIPEFPVRVSGNNTYRIDYKLTTIPNFLEIDSSIHVNKGWSKCNADLVRYADRDKKKDLLLEGNLERIKLYDDNNQHLPMMQQLKIIEEAFINRLNNNGLNIKKSDIEKAKRDQKFFRNSKTVSMLKRLEYFHKDHIGINYSDHHSIIEIYDSDLVEFICKIHLVPFRRKLSSVFKLGFLCPICKNLIKTGKQKNYFVAIEKAVEIKKIVEDKFQGELIFQEDEFGQNIRFFQSVVFGLIFKNNNQQVFLSMNELLSVCETKILSKLKSIVQFENYKMIKKERIINEYEPIIVKNIDQDQRDIQNKRSVNDLEIYQKAAKLINQIIRKDHDQSEVNLRIDQNETIIKSYIHKTEKEAKQCLVTFDRQILPYFDNIKTFQLLTPRKNYAFNKQFLLIKGNNCDHRFYCSWNWILCRKKMGKEIQCQHVDCYGKYYKQVFKSGNKLSLGEKLKIFQSMYHGQYYPLYPSVDFYVREIIEIIHLPTQTLIKASFDNFKRGKFQNCYKNNSLDELKSIFKYFEFPPN